MGSSCCEHDGGKPSRLWVAPHPLHPLAPRDEEESAGASAGKGIDPVRDGQAIPPGPPSPSSQKSWKGRKRKRLRSNTSWKTSKSSPRWTALASPVTHDTWNGVRHED